MLSSLDLYAKAPSVVQKKSLRGGIMTLGVGLFMCYLFLSELSDHFSVKVNDRLFVDSYAHLVDTRVTINLRVSFHAAPCSDLHLDVQDKNGRQQADAVINVKKTPYPLTIAKAAEVISGGDDARAAADAAAPGCTLAGTMEVHKKEAQFYIMGAVSELPHGASFEETLNHPHHMVFARALAFNASHTVEHFSFGEDFPGKFNALDGVVKGLGGGGGGGGGGAVEKGPGKTGLLYQYFVQVVPTTYHHVGGAKTKSHQYSVTEHRRNARMPGMGITPPGIVFGYVFSPIAVDFTETQQGLFNFATRMCAVLGGMFTVAGMLSSTLGTVIGEKMD